MNKIFILLSVFVFTSSTRDIFENFLITYKIPVSKPLELVLDYNEDALLNFTELTTKYGFPSEEHSVTTKNGYILNLFRIPFLEKCKKDQKTVPIMLMHGLLATSDDFIITGPDTALGYSLANRCYDLWFPNFRGNKYSRKHVKLNPDKDAQYWDHTIDQMGMYDLPEFIDYVLEKTQSEKVSYIGFSMGTTTFFILASSRPEYNDKINVMIALAPVAWCYNFPNEIVRTLARYEKELKLAFDSSGHRELTGAGTVGQEAFKFIAQKIPDLFSTLFLKSTSINNKTMSAASGHLLSGVSTDVLIHFLQLGNEDVFRRFNKGVFNNWQLYGTPTPPEYDVTKITAPVALLLGKTDELISVKNANKLNDRLQNVVDYCILPLDNFIHLDFMLSDLIPEYVLPKVLKYLENDFSNTNTFNYPPECSYEN